MGLGDIVDEYESHNGRAYPDHERQEELEEWLEELSEAFPEDLHVDFIEVSPKMTKYDAKAYWDKASEDRDRYIRVAKSSMENYTDKQIKALILHELCHIWFYQKGHHDVTEKDERFTYVLGAVGASVSGVGHQDEVFKDTCSPFSEYL